VFSYQSVSLTVDLVPKLFYLKSLHVVRGGTFIAFDIFCAYEYSLEGFEEGCTTPCVEDALNYVKKHL